METEKIPVDKCCSKCDQTKAYDKFISKRNICKECCNQTRRDKYNIIEIDNENYQTCVSCNQDKLLSSYIRCRNICKDCDNQNRRNKYKTDELHRQKLIKQATDFKHNKIIEKNLLKLEEIGKFNELGKALRIPGYFNTKEYIQKWVTENGNSDLNPKIVN